MPFYNVTDTFHGNPIHVIYSLHGIAIFIASDKFFPSI